MVREAEAHAADDQQRRREIEARNQTDSLLYAVERGLADPGARLEANERSTIDQAVKDARAALESNDADRIRRAQDALDAASRTLARAGQRPSAEAGAQPGAAKEGEAPKDREGHVVDAEFEDVDDRRKAG
jgi:molecular chaperone DnaK